MTGAVPIESSASAVPNVGPEVRGEVELEDLASSELYGSMVYLYQGVEKVANAISPSLYIL